MRKVISLPRCHTGMTSQLPRADRARPQNAESKGVRYMTIKITRLDLGYILTQIEMAEAGQDPVNPLLSFGLREVAGTNNNLAPGQSTFGASDVLFPTLTD